MSLTGGGVNMNLIRMQGIRIREVEPGLIQEGGSLVAGPVRTPNARGINVPIYTLARAGDWLVVVGVVRKVGAAGERHLGC